jgi:rubrerythrin
VAQDELLHAFLLSEQMETDGRDYYLKLADQSVNERGRALFRHLAAQEDVHRQRLREILATMQKGGEIPLLEVPHDAEKLRTIFSQAVGNLEGDIAAPEAETDAVRIALEMERRSIEFYEAQAKEARDENARCYYRALVSEEKRHHAALLEYCDYVTDPDGWVVSKTRLAPGACFLPGAAGNVSQVEW